MTIPSIGMKNTDAMMIPIIISMRSIDAVTSILSTSIADARRKIMIANIRNTDAVKIPIIINTNTADAKRKVVVFSIDASANAKTRRNASSVVWLL